MINRSNYRKGYEIITQNAKVHFNAAEILAENGYYGLANSHLILASEELVKGYIVFAQHYDKDLIVSKFDKFFKDHKYKHELIKEMTFFISFLKQMINVILNPTKKLIIKKKKKITSKDIIKAKDEGVNNLIKWLKQSPELNYNEDWWNSANHFKNQGFYVNLKGGNWQSPKSIKKSDYKKSYSIVLEFMEWLDMIPEVEHSSEMAELYKKMKNE